LRKADLKVGLYVPLLDPRTAVRRMRIAERRSAADLRPERASTLRDSSQVEPPIN